MKQGSHSLGSVHKNAPYGSALADEFIKEVRYKTKEGVAHYECTLCAFLEIVYNEGHAPVALSTSRGHVTSKHAEEFKAELERRANEEYGKQLSDIEFISVEGNGTFGCKVCQTDTTHRQDMTGDSMYGSLTDVRAHLLKRHGEKLAEFIADEVRAKDAATNKPPSLKEQIVRPLLMRGYGSHVEDEHIRAVAVGQGSSDEYECPYCSSMSSPRTADLAAAREHFRTVHNDEYKQAITRAIEKSREYVVVNKLDERYTIVNTNAIPRLARPEGVTDESFGEQTADSHLNRVGLSLPSETVLYDCALCDNESAFMYPLDLGRKHVIEVHLSKGFGRDWRDRWLDWRVVAGSRGDVEFDCRLCDFSTEQLVDRTMREAREHVLKHAPDASHVPLGIKVSAMSFGTSNDRMYIAPVGSIGGLYECRVCDPTPNRWQGSLDRVRQHVEREHALRLDRAAFLGKVLTLGAVDEVASVSYAGQDITERLREGGHLMTTMPPCEFEFKGDQPCEPAPLTPTGLRRLGELKIVAEGGGRIKHEKCGETFDTTDEALHHECVAERLPVSDDVVLLRGHLAADAADRRHERERVREVIAQAGSLATKLREVSDDLFELLATATSVLDDYARGQVTNERRRQDLTKGGES